MGGNDNDLVLRMSDGTCFSRLGKVLEEKD